MINKPLPPYSIIAIVPGITVVLLITLMINYQNQKASDKAKLLTQTPTATTTAYIFNYHIGMSKMEKGKVYEAQLVDYVYFVDEKKYQFTRTLGNLNARFDKFKKPQYVLLKYAKPQPEIHDLMLEIPVDSIKMF